MKDLTLNPADLSWPLLHLSEGSPFFQVTNTTAENSQGLPWGSTLKTTIESYFLGTFNVLGDG